MLRSWSRRLADTQVVASSVATNCIKVVSYNILANKYALGGNHSYCEERHLAWSYRSKLIKEELKQYDCDLVCLQEVEDGVFASELQPWFRSLGFEGWFNPREYATLFLEAQETNLGGPSDGTALFYRSSMFRAINTHIVEFASCSQPTGISIPQRIPRHGFWQTYQSRQEGAIIAVLEHLPSACPMVVACTHLFWNPRFPDVKALQAAVLCQEVAWLLNKCYGHLDVPVLIGGDFNSLCQKFVLDIFDSVLPAGGLSSGVYTLLASGCLSSEHPDHPYQRRRAVSSSSSSSGSVPGGQAMAAVLGTAEEECSELAGIDLHSSGLSLCSMQDMSNGWEPPLTTKTASFAGCLDYIWLSKGHFKVSQTLDLPYPLPSRQPAPEGSPETSKVVSQLPGPAWSDPLRDIDFPAIPNEEFPSDHLAVGCVVDLLLPAWLKQQQVQQQEQQLHLVA